VSRIHRRTVQAETIAPWVALSVILLSWWAGARTLQWVRPHFGGSAYQEPSPPEVRSARALDKTEKETRVSASSISPTLTADVKITGVDIAMLRNRQLQIPVDGVTAERLVDSFNDGRDGRKHDAIDILAPRGTEVHAVEDGKIAKLFTSAAGGLTVYEFEPGEQFVYYYAHLDGYAPAAKEGNQVKRGEVLGYVGTTGNAPKNTPHLHFAIEKLGPDRRWWQGMPLDPFLVWRDPTG
jgi:peptidoglycan LD-endopeptidase LytH